MKFFSFAVFGAALVSAASLTSPLEARTSSIDICASARINVGRELSRATGRFFPPSPYKTDVCLCVSTIPTLIQSNDDLARAARKYGFQTIYNAIAAIIYTHQPKACNTPWNAEPICKPGNPCAFKCKWPFVLSANKKQCVLPASGRVKREEAVLKSADVCPTGHQQCRVWNSLSAFECVDVNSDLFSCGGCVHGGVEGEAKGRDCSAIEGVSDVGCVAGGCQIRKCSNGWKLSEDGENCVRA